MKKKALVMMAAALMVSMAAAGQGRVVTRTVTINGSDVSTSASTKNAEDAIDRVAYRITYHTQSSENHNAQDTARHDYGIDDMRLDIGTKVSKFYSYTRVRHDSLMRAQAAKGDFDFRKIGSAGALSWTVYRNYPEGKTLLLARLGNERYRIAEDTQMPEWELVGDSTKTILGYPCTLATATFKGRQWRAWFTEDIPLDNGPWKLCGLPGLILRAQDSEAEFIFDAIGLEQGSDEAITYDKKADKYDDITFSKFVELKRRNTPGAMLDAMNMGGAKVRMVHQDGTAFTDAEMQKWLNKTSPYNPIER